MCHCGSGGLNAPVANLLAFSSETGGKKSRGAIHVARIPVAQRDGVRLKQGAANDSAYYQYMVTGGVFGRHFTFKMGHDVIQ